MPPECTSADRSWVGRDGSKAEPAATTAARAGGAQTPRPRLQQVCVGAPLARDVEEAGNARASGASSSSTSLAEPFK
jgi:hypothetical protein